MKTATSKMIMKGVGATLAVCSALAMASGTKSAPSSTKKAVKKPPIRLREWLTQSRPLCKKTENESSRLFI